MRIDVVADRDVREVRVLVGVLAAAGAHVPGRVRDADPGAQDGLSLSGRDGGEAARDERERKQERTTQRNSLDRR